MAMSNAERQQRYRDRHYDRWVKAGRVIGHGDNQLLKQIRERGPPDNPYDFVEHGGMRFIEHTAVYEATKVALRIEREIWLPKLEEWAKQLTAKEDRPYKLELERHIKRLRRCLGLIKPRTEDELRSMNKERVARHRSKK